MVIPDFDSRIDELKQIISFIKKNKTGTQGHLRISTNGQYERYYCVTQKGDTKGKYLRKSEMDKVRNLAQNDYNRDVLRSAEKELKELEMLKQAVSTGRFEDIYNLLNEKRKMLVTPIVPTDDMYVRDWLAQSYTRKPFEAADNTEFYTASGIRMRSKSEVNIGNALERKHVPFLPEFPIFLDGLGWIYPDFYILNVRLRKVIIWEHHGMLDDTKYREKNFLLKNKFYLANGYIPGDNLIQTFESKDHPLGSRTIDTYIDRYLI